MTSTSGHLASRARLHLDLHWLKSWLAMCIVDMVTVSTQVQELPHADGALIANDLRHVVAVIGSHVGAMHAVVNGILVWGVAIIR